MSIGVLQCISLWGVCTCAVLAFLVNVPSLRALDLTQYRINKLFGSRFPFSLAAQYRMGEW